jgi:hypothetical protein
LLVNSKSLEFDLYWLMSFDLEMLRTLIYVLWR